MKRRSLRFGDSDNDRMMSKDKFGEMKISTPRLLSRDVNLLSIFRLR